MSSLRKKANKHRTPISQHKKVGQKLIPPMAQIPNMQPSSWPSDRLPDMLWAAIIVSNFPREEALKRFVSVVNKAAELVSELGEDFRKRPWLVTHTGIAELSDESREALITAIAPDDATRRLLAPLLLFENLPAREAWEKVLGPRPDGDEEGSLAKAIGTTYLHQEQAATDIRWLKVAYALVSGTLIAPPEIAREIAEYPGHDEETMRRSRPTMRSLEISFANATDKTSWPADFWQECLRNSPCAPTQLTLEELQARFPSQEQVAEDKAKTVKLTQDLTDHFWNTLTTTAVDPRHLVSFGFALYAAELVTILLAMGLERTPQARMTLRSLAECLITFSYLAKKDEEGLWAAFQKHGEGQAKLVYQRTEDEGRTPAYLDKPNMHQIANDELWDEFLTINIGNWDGSNLRKMSDEVGLKSIYDDYYTWTSAYTHGTWGAIREATFDICKNPLHRFHKVPQLMSMNQPSCRDDLYLLLDQIVAVLYSLYPAASEEEAPAPEASEAQ